MIYNETLNDHGKVCHSCTTYSVFFIFVGIWKNIILILLFNTNSQTLISKYKKMLYYNKFNISEGIAIGKSNKLRGWIICHYWYF